jgi:glutathione S-transferase
MLEELGVPYEIVTVDLAAKENREPGYLRVHPLGQVPALVDGDVTVFESIAICMYLADRCSERGLAPSVSSPLRAPYYQWLLFCASTIESAIGRWAQHGGDVTEAEREKARARFAEAAELLTRTLATREHMLGDAFSTVDVIVGSNLNWARRRPARRARRAFGLPGPPARAAGGATRFRRLTDTVSRGSRLMSRAVAPTAPAPVARD